MEGNGWIMKNGMKHHMFGKNACSPSTVQVAAADSSAVHAQSEVQSSSKTAERPLDVVITIKADIKGKIDFVFQDYKIFCKHVVKNNIPSNASVNGIPWNDPEKPFEMGFTPDFSFAKIYEKQGRGSIELSLGKKQFKLSVSDSGKTAAPYQISIAMWRAKEEQAAK